MDRQMPPPLSGPESLESWEHVVGSPVAGSPRRPAAVTIAGVLLVVAGVFAGFAGLLILTTGDGATIEGVGGGGVTLPVVVTLVLALGEIASGVLVLRSLALGRPLGLVIAGLGVAGGFADIGSPRSLVTIAIFGFVVVVLATNAEAFRRTGEG
ncbi:MAG TPA: hypothetical protein VNC60_00355 [Actinomycetota bacterium]|nr:hypothetical protein [Actinomycetota bacterium]